MKKLLMMVAVAGASALFAQKPVGDNKVSLEGQFNILNAAANNFVAPSVKLRFFVSDNIAARLTFTGTGNSSTEKIYQVANPMSPDSAETHGVYKSSNFNLLIPIGAEYHFDGTERLSPYVGADIVIGMGSFKEMSTDVDVATDAAYVEGASKELKGKTFSYGFNLVGGMDFYVAKNVYLGAELGWGLTTTRELKGTATVQADAATAAVESVYRPELTSTTINNNFLGGLRLGWRF